MNIAAERKYIYLTDNNTSADVCFLQLQYVNKRTQILQTQNTKTIQIIIISIITANYRFTSINRSRYEQFCNTANKASEYVPLGAQPSNKCRLV